MISIGRLSDSWGMLDSMKFFSLVQLSLALTAVALLSLPVAASAHQPRLVTGTDTTVSEPEISKAYYGQLTGQPQTFRISAMQPFDLYVNILVPDRADQKKDVTATVTKIGDATTTLAVLNKTTESPWKRMWEAFGRDWYWQGEEYKTRAIPGEYVVQVSSVQNDSRYSLAIGEAEHFTARDGWNAARLIPTLKNDFFGTSPAGFILSPFGIAYIVTLFVAAFLFGLLYRFLLKLLVQKGVRAVTKNIGSSDRWLRAALGLGLFVGALFTSWSPVLFFFAGFCLFESLFSWCGLYAALGKNTCPVA